MAKKKAEPYQYGHSPNPHNWHVAAQALTDGHAQKKKGSNLMDRLDRIETMLQEKKK